MNRRKFFGIFAKGVAVATVAPTVIASVLNTPAPAMSVTSRVFDGSAVSGMFIQDEIGKTMCFDYKGTKFLYQKGIDDTVANFQHKLEMQLLTGEKEQWIK